MEENKNMENEVTTTEENKKPEEPKKEQEKKDEPEKNGRHERAVRFGNRVQKFAQNAYEHPVKTIGGIAIKVGIGVGVYKGVKGFLKNHGFFGGNGTNEEPNYDENDVTEE